MEPVSAQPHRQKKHDSARELVPLECLAATQAHQVFSGPTITLRQKLIIVQANWIATYDNNIPLTNRLCHALTTELMIEGNEQ